MHVRNSLEDRVGFLDCVDFSSYFFFHKSSVVKVSASNFEVLSRAVSRLDLSHQLIFSRNITFSFPRGAGYPTYWVFINVKCRRDCLMRGTFFRFGRSPPLGEEEQIWLASLA